METNEIPCIDCITLPICRATAKNYDSGIKDKELTYSFIVAFILANKCTLIRNYIYKHCSMKTGIFDHEQHQKDIQRVTRNRQAIRDYLKFKTPSEYF